MGTYRAWKVLSTVVVRWKWVGLVDTCVPGKYRTAMEPTHALTSHRAWPKKGPDLKD